MEMIKKCQNIDQAIEKKILKVNDFAALREMVIKESFHLADVAEYRMPPLDKPYGRKLIFASEKVEVIVMNWKEDAYCDIHNHGESFGIALVLQGAIKNEVFDTVYKLRLESVHIPGDIIDVPKNAFHRMGNLLKQKNSVTLHFYTPPIHHMKVVDVYGNKIATVQDDCGAWLLEQDKIIEIQQF